MFNLIVNNIIFVIKIHNMTHSFLPKKPPIKTYSDNPSESLLRLEEIAGNLPKLLLTGKVQSLINSLDKNDLSVNELFICLLYTSPSPRDRTRSRMPSSA